MRQSLMIIFIFYSQVASSQQTSNYIFRHIDQTNGLLHNNVLCISQDKKGFIWIGTDNGLQRYDGQKFVGYQDELNTWNNKSVTLRNLSAVSTSGLWLLSDYQFGKLETNTDKFTAYDAEQMLKDPIFKYDTYTDAQNSQWLLGDFSIYKYDSILKKMGLYLLNVPNGNIHCSNNIIKDSEHNITWVASGNGLLLFDAKNKKVYSNQNNPLQHPLLKVPSHSGYSKIMMDSHKNIWLCSWDHHLYKYDPGINKITTYSLLDIKNSERDKNNINNTFFVYCVYEDKNENIWLGTEHAGLLKYNPTENNFDCIISTGENKEGLRYNYSIYSIFQDKEENIWVGTDKGINIFNPYHNYFQTIRHEKNNIHSLPKNEITDFIESNNGDIMVGTWGGGVSIYDNQLRFKNNILMKGVPETNLVWCLLKNEDGKIWIGCQHGYLHIYDPVNGNIVTIHPPEFGNFTIRCMQKDIEGNIWLGLHNGKIAKWDKLLNTFLPYNNRPQQVIQTFNPVLKIFIDQDKNYWAGTDDGLKQFDPHKMIYTAVFTPDKNNIYSISARGIRGIEQYNDSSLLIGTINGGLNLFNTKTKIFSHFNAAVGLSSNSIHAIKKNGKNNIWLTTDYGLYKFRADEKNTIAYNIEAARINSSFESNHFYPLHDGRWLTATSTEIISFYPDSLTHQSDYHTNIAICGFRVFDKAMFIDSLLSANKPVTLNYNQNFITIEFAALNFSDIQQTKYYYRLSGVDKDWVNADTKRFANYTNLEPGDYTFSVKTEEGYDASQTSFSIILTPPLWKTGWFRTLVVMVIVLIVYTVVRRRIGSIRHEAELKHKIAETEMMALRAQMNPHFIFNCLNAIDNLIQTNQKDKATTYLARFAKLIRSVLESSKNNVVPFHKEYDALNLFLQLEQFRCDNKFQYQLKAEDELMNGDYKVPPLLVQPFIENAIHHGLMNKPGPDKKLSVQIQVDNETIKYTIEDNGVGRVKAMQIKKVNRPEHISYGIQISTERIHLYNRNGHSYKSNGLTKDHDIIITDLSSNGEPCGTKVEVFIRINNHVK